MIAANFAVRSATDTERLKLANLLLPGGAASTADMMVAVLDDDEQPLGAAAVWYAPSRQFPECANLTMHVLEPHRRNGIGRSLLQSAIAAARKVAPKELRVGPFNQASAGFQFATACGFEAKSPTVSYEAPLEDYIKAFTPIYKRLAARGRIPLGARVIPLKEANPEEVCRLIIDNLGFPSQNVAERLRGTEHGFSQTISRVALLDGKLVGAILMTYHKAMAMVAGTAVLPEHRNSWVNAALKYHALQELIIRDVSTVRFSANDNQHRDTANFARRIGARVLGKVSAMTLDLTKAQ